MNTSMKRFLFLVLAVLMMIPTFALGEKKEESPDEEYVYIGVSGPFTGDYAEYGEYFRTATIMGMERINEQGGIRGKELKLVFEDSRSDPKESVLVAQKFVSDKKIIAVVGDFTSSASMAAAEIYNSGELTQISPTASHPEYTKIGKFSFRAGTTQEVEGPVIAEWAVGELGYKTVSSIYINNDWGIVANKYFVLKAKALGADVILEEPYLGGEKDFAAIITKIKHQNPEMVYLGTPWADAGAIATQMRKADFSPALMGASILATEKIIEMAGPAVEGMKAITNVTSPVFLNDYRKRWEKEPHSDHCGLAYDALMLLANAIETGGFDRLAIRDALAETEGFEGVTGDFSFDENRNPIKSVSRIMVKDGKWVSAVE